MPAHKAHKVAVLAFHGVVMSDLGTAADVFEVTELPSGRRPYQVRVCGPSRRIKTRAFDLQLKWTLQDLVEADTVIVPGTEDPLGTVPPALVEALRQAKAAGARVASICSGAFVLAATGLLDGRRATTHWKAAALLAEQYPQIDVEPNMLFTDNGKLLTSAGASAGLDLCLHMIRKDHGAAVAARTARMAVAPLERAGGQAQFIERPLPKSNLSLSPVLQWIEARIDRPLTLEALADQGAVSVRTLSRRFQEQLGMSPLRWVIQARVKQAQCLLENSDLPIETVAANVGFGSSASLREHFTQAVGVGPQAYRRSFRRKPGAVPGRH